MWPNLQETADLVTFTEEITNGELHFLCIEGDDISIYAGDESELESYFSADISEYDKPDTDFSPSNTFAVLEYLKN